MKKQRVCAGLLAIGLLAGCSGYQQQDSEQAKKEAARDNGERVGEKAREIERDTRDERARIAAEAKVAAEKLKQESLKLGTRAAAAAQGVKQGWEKDAAQVNVNAAGKAELMKLPGIGGEEATRIIAKRPYKAKRQLVERGAITEGNYQQIENRIRLD